ncbi:MAG: hypothetical protein AAF667_09615 [Pseudomonadota bacterium]
MKSPVDLGWLRDQLPAMTLPTIGRAVQIPVYMIHNSPDAEDYFFIFDFEEFVERSRGGLFVRPALKIWAGRSDFSRRAFARQFREAFAREFEAARQQLAEKSEKKGWGWFSWDLGLQGVAGMISALVANIVLLIALQAGRAVFGNLARPDWLRGKSDAVQLEDRIEDTKARVDSALERVEVVLHKDLYRHAWRGGPPGRLSGVDYEAWPLPEHVERHLSDGKSGSWW